MSKKNKQPMASDQQPNSFQSGFQPQSLTSGYEGNRGNPQMNPNYLREYVPQNMYAPGYPHFNPNLPMQNPMYHGFVQGDGMMMMPPPGMMMPGDISMNEHVNMMQQHPHTMQPLLHGAAMSPMANMTLNPIATPKKTDSVSTPSTEPSTQEVIAKVSPATVPHTPTSSTTTTTTTTTTTPAATTVSASQTDNSATTSAAPSTKHGEYIFITKSNIKYLATVVKIIRDEKENSGGVENEDDPIIITFKNVQVLGTESRVPHDSPSAVLPAPFIYDKLVVKKADLLYMQPSNSSIDKYSFSDPYLLEIGEPISNSTNLADTGDVFAGYLGKAHANFNKIEDQRKKKGQQPTTKYYDKEKSFFDDPGDQYQNTSKRRNNRNMKTFVPDSERNSDRKKKNYDSYNNSRQHFKNRDDETFSDAAYQRETPAPKKDFVRFKQFE